MSRPHGEPRPVTASDQPDGRACPGRRIDGEELAQGAEVGPEQRARCRVEGQAEAFAESRNFYPGNPSWDPIRDDPRFQASREGMGLAE